MLKRRKYTFWNILTLGSNAEALWTTNKGMFEEKKYMNNELRIKLVTDTHFCVQLMWFFTLRVGFTHATGYIFCDGTTLSNVYNAYVFVTY